MQVPFCCILATASFTIPLHGAGLSASIVEYGAAPVPGTNNGLTVGGFELHWADGMPDFFTDGIRIEDFRNVRINAFSGRQASPDGQGAAINLVRGSKVTVQDCVAPMRTGLFLKTNQAQGDLFANNDLSQATVISEPKLMPFQKVFDNVLP